MVLWRRKHWFNVNNTKNITIFISQKPFKDPSKTNPKYAYFALCLILIHNHWNVFLFILFHSLLLRKLSPTYTASVMHFRCQLLRYLEFLFKERKSRRGWGGLVLIHIVKWLTLPSLGGYERISISESQGQVDSSAMGCSTQRVV